MAPRILVSNDDGIDAPGLRALVIELAAAGMEVLVCAPTSERSGQSHAITLTRFLECHPRHGDVQGAAAAYAVDGSPADSVMLALHGPVFKERNFDLVISGINRGDNAGLHVVYSGTVGAAREAACKGIPAMAVSLDSHGAKRLEQYGPSAKLSAMLAKALIEVLTESPGALSDVEEGLVINVNFPAASQVSEMRGVKLTHQGTGCFFPEFREVEEEKGPHLPQIDEHTESTRVFRNYAGGYRSDGTQGSDMQAVAGGWVSVTPLGLRQDLNFKSRSGGAFNSGVSALQERHARGCVGIAAQVVARAAAAAGLAADGVEGVEWPVTE